MQPAWISLTCCPSELRSRDCPPSPPPHFGVLGSLDRFLAVLSSERPLLLVLDDLQAADHSSFRVLEHVARATAGDRLLVLSIHGEGAFRGGHPRPRAYGNHFRGGEDLCIHLEPLGKADANRLVSALSQGALNPDIAQAIRKRSAGNPRFLRELVLSFTEDAVSPAPCLPLPLDIRELVRSRSENLEPAIRAALVASAIIGSEFEVDVLRQLVDLGAPRLLIVSTLRSSGGGWGWMRGARCATASSSP